MSDDDKLIKAFGVWWRFGYIPSLDFGSEYGLEGPFCLNCYCTLELELHYSGKSYTVKCQNCSKTYEFNLGQYALRKKAEDLYNAKSRSLQDKVSLDEPPTRVSVRDSDESYFIAAKIGQKDGKRVGVVYFGEKNDKQSKEDYSQIFIDLDDEQLRFDKSNKHPKEILLKFRAEFPDTKIDQCFKQSDQD